MMDHERIAYLRGEVEAERVSWGEVAEIQAAFEEIDPTTLPEPAENAGLSDMLDELEARLSRTYCIGLPVSVTVHPDGTVTFAVDLSEAHEAPHEDDETDDETAEADAATIRAAVEARPNAPAWGVVS